MEVVTREEIEQFLDRLSAEGASWNEVEAGFWRVRPAGELDLDVVVNYAPPVVVLRVKVMDLPKDAASLSRLSRQLLEWNANDLLHGSYGIHKNAIVLTEALELSHLDYEEFVAAYESMTLALAGHLRELAAYREAR
jgi:hypothetical protein